MRCGHTTKVGPEMIIDLEPGVWIWRIPRPHWEPDGGGPEACPAVFSPCKRGRGRNETIISHGEPVHDRAEFERALEREPIAVD